MQTKTLSLRLKDEEYRFLVALAGEERADLSTTVRELVDRGRVLMAIQKYRKGEVSLERASRLAGTSVSLMMDILREYGVDLDLDQEDYLASLRNLRKVW